MKKILIVVVMICAASAMAWKDLILPAPQKNGGMSLAEALNIRHTVRKFRKTELTPQQLANILWSANGINRENGKRTAPSALDKREVMIYVITETGAYVYDPDRHMKEHRLTRLPVAEDLRKYCGRYEAPCYLVLVPDKSKQANEIFAAVDTGYVSQNIYLAAQANGLGTCAMGSIADRKMLIKKLDLGKNVPLLVHPVGVPG